MSDEETGEVWLSWLVPSFLFLVGVMVDAGLDVILVYFREPFSCKGFADFFIKSQCIPLVVVVADGLLLSIECLFVVVEIHKY